jgi:hypothetical protein
MGAGLVFCFWMRIRYDLEHIMAEHQDALLCDPPDEESQVKVGQPFVTQLQCTP